MPDLVTVPREPSCAFGDYVLVRWTARDGSPAAEVGRWLAGHPGNPQAKHRLTPGQVAQAVPEAPVGEAEAEWRDRRGWTFDTFPCGCSHRDWAGALRSHFRRRGERWNAAVVALADLDADAEVREACWDGPRTYLVTTNDSLDVAADWKVARGEGDLRGVTVYRRVEPEPVTFEAVDESETLL